MEFLTSRLTVWAFLLIIIVICLSVADSDGALNCPIKCKCNATSVTCHKKQLMRVPDMKKLTWGPSILDLSDNDIEEIKATTFANKLLEMVTTIFLNDNSVLSIEVAAFSTLPNLQHLDLSNNLLDHVPTNMIKKNHQLTELNLSGNLFTSKTPQLFSESLQVLDLSFSKISAFTEVNLKGLPNLQVLHLHANSLKFVDYNIFVDTNLRRVDLSFNCWKCHCDTIKLFDYLVQAELTEVDRPIQCMLPNKWYDDIYDSKGPMHQNKLCNKKHHHDKHVGNPINSTKDAVAAKEEKTPMEERNTVMEYEVFIYLMAGVVVALVVLSVISVLIVRKSSQPKVHIYEELQNVAIQSRANSNCFPQKTNSLA